MGLVIEKKNKKNIYPSKTTMNLCFKEKKQINPLVAIPLCLLIIAAAALFSKYAVVDRLNELYDANQRIAEAQKRVEEMTELTADYDQISLEYARYSINWMSDSERYLVLRTDMIDLINTELTSAISSVKSVTMSGNKISVVLNNANLESTSKLVDQLCDREDITNVAVYSAVSADGIKNIVTVDITMQYIQEAE